MLVPTSALGATGEKEKKEYPGGLRRWPAQRRPPRRTDAAHVRFGVPALSGARAKGARRTLDTAATVLLGAGGLLSMLPATSRPTAARLRVPVLVQHGERDSLMNGAQARAEHYQRPTASRPRCSRTWATTTTSPRPASALGGTQAVGGVGHPDLDMSSEPTGATVPTISRRRFLGGVAATTAASLAATTGISRAMAAAVPVVDEQRRVVIIGSGFGGAVTALRLAQAGVQVLLLERGIQWPTGPNAETFARQFAPDQRCAWLTTSPTLTAVRPRCSRRSRCAGPSARQRGGHPVRRGRRRRFPCYHGMTLQPTEPVFAEVLPQWTTASWPGPITRVWPTCCR